MTGGVGGGGSTGRTAATLMALDPRAAVINAPPLSPLPNVQTHRELFYLHIMAHPNFPQLVWDGEEKKEVWVMYEKI